MLSPSYFLILILGSQRKTLEQGSTATFPKKYTHRFVAGFVLFFINLLLSNRYGSAISFCLVPQGILGALCLETERPGTLGDEANFPASPVPDGQRDSRVLAFVSGKCKVGNLAPVRIFTRAARMALLGLGDWQSTSLHFPEASGLEHWFLSWVSLAEQSTPLSRLQSLGAVPQSWCLNSLAGLRHSGCWACLPACLSLQSCPVSLQHPHLLLTGDATTRVGKQGLLTTALMQHFANRGACWWAAK